MQSINSSGWNIDQFDVYARMQTEKVEREISQLNSEIRRVSSLTFKDPELAAKLTKLDREDFDETLNLLRSDPQKLGKIRGGHFSPIEHQEALHQAKHLRALLLTKEDKRVVLERYEKMHFNTLSARELPSHEKSEALARMQGEREYCDTTYEVRERERCERLAPYDDDRDARSAERAEAAPKDRANQKEEWWDKDLAKSRALRGIEQHRPPVDERPLARGEPMRLEDPTGRREAEIGCQPYIGIPEFDRETGEVSHEWEQRREEQVRNYRDPSR